MIQVSFFPLTLAKKGMREECSLLFPFGGLPPGIQQATLQLKSQTAALTSEGGSKRSSP
ncbi:hypothetical protein [Paenibacillus sp. S150]|uniref:hypothetical protein n=1 Tax=Paenibacillus sp. S150 TaxID=2749826 RepID=UPI001C57BDF2|nr:hypothetical protein [Paenibacillus sp. S150]MBW4079927.1 hypothetical protein [Paenibacillus sp. S150]